MQKLLIVIILNQESVFNYCNLADFNYIKGEVAATITVKVSQAEKFMSSLIYV